MKLFILKHLSVNRKLWAANSQAEETRTACEQTDTDVIESTMKVRMEVTEEKTVEETLNETGDKIRRQGSIYSEICFHQIDVIKLEFFLLMLPRRVKRRFVAQT